MQSSKFFFIVILNLFKNLYRPFYRSKGFTLVEVLAVIAVFGTVGIITISILVSSLRGANKTNTIIGVKDEGNRAIFYMTQAIRYAKKFNGMIDSGGTVYPDCTVYPPVGTSPTPTPAYYAGVKITSFDDKETVFKCCLSGSSLTIASASALSSCTDSSSLLETTLVSVPTPTPFNLDLSCYFTCKQQGPSDFPDIGIHFSLTQANSNAPLEKTASSGAIPFQTSVVMRNLYK